MSSTLGRLIITLLVTTMLLSCDKTAIKPDTTVDAQPSSGIAPHVYQPDIDIPELFARVQMEMIYPDSKTFVDAIPKQSPAIILAKYQQQQHRANFDLKNFIEQHFELPAPLVNTPVNNETSMEEHLKSHWTNLLRNPQKTSEYSTLIALPNPYIVPGGRFREMFYWDSYFTLVGLLLSGQDHLALDMIDNFAYLINQYGYIPNGNRTYFLSRSQPPFFAAMLQLYGKKHGNQAIVKYLPQLEREYAYWMDNRESLGPRAEEGKHLIMLANGDYLNRYYGARDVPRAEAFNKETNWAQGMDNTDKKLFFRNLRAACESGWDFSSRWFADGKTKTTINTMDIVPVDLSSLLYSLEKTLASLHQYNHNHNRAEFFSNRAAQRQALIRKYHYDPATGSYQDYNHVTGAHTGQLSIAMVFPLFVGAASSEEAASVTKVISEKFLMPGGVVTSLTQSGEQWDYPNGWAPMQYIAVEGLLQYNQKPLAMDIARRWLALNERVYKEEGKMMEKYNVVDTQLKAGGGNYPNQDGFGWTNGVDLAFYQLLNQPAHQK